MPNKLFNECEECMNARATEVCPGCRKDLCAYCLEEHLCDDLGELGGDE